MSLPNLRGTPSLDSLLSHAGWMRGLASRLVKDDAAADDVVQRTWVAALTAPPEPSKAAPWLASVVRRIAARTHRERTRRGAREEHVAQREPALVQDPSPETLVERAELQQRIATEVLRLDEPYRSTVLLRYYEDLEASEIARRLLLPEPTVRTRLRRAHEQLRDRLTRRYGQREAWVALALPLTSIPVFAESAASVTATTAASSIQPATALTLGGIIMVKPIALTALVVGVAALAVGYSVGTGSAPTSDLSTEVVSREEHLEAVAKRQEAEAQLAAAHEENEKLRQRADELAAQLDAKVESVVANTATPEIAEAAPGEEGLAISFGGLDIEALKRTEWENLALTIQQIDEEVLAIMANLLEGKNPDAQAQMRIMNLNKPLQDFAISIIGKLPTHQSGNGEFSHPIATANLAAAYLDKAGVPFTDAQRATISQLGGEYAAAFAQLSYDDDSFQLERVIDELELKNSFVSQMHEVMDADQFDALVRPSTHGRCRLDTLSPSVMLAMNSGPVAGRDRTQLRGELVERAAGHLGIPEVDLRASRVFDDWIADVDSILTPEPEALHGVYTSEQAAIAGRAQVRAMRALANEMRLSDAQLASMRNMPFLLVPRLTQADGGDAGQ